MRIDKFIKYLKETINSLEIIEEHHGNLKIIFDKVFHKDVIPVENIVFIPVLDQKTSEKKLLVMPDKPPIYTEEILETDNGSIS